MYVVRSTRRVRYVREYEEDKCGRITWYSAWRCMSILFIFLILHPHLVQVFSQHRPVEAAFSPCGWERNIPAAVWKKAPGLTCLLFLLFLKCLIERWELNFPQKREVLKKRGKMGFKILQEEERETAGSGCLPLKSLGHQKQEQQPGWGVNYEKREKE